MLPRLSPDSHLAKSSIALSIDINTALDKDKLCLYAATIYSIKTLLYNSNYTTIKKKYVNEVLMPDFIYINAGLPDIKSAKTIKKYFDEAYAAISTALSLFGREEDENAFTRLQGRFTALNICRENLDKALMYFPKDDRLEW